MPAGMPSPKGMLQRYQRLAWRDRTPIRAIKKSRRIGMSYSEIGRAVQDAIRKSGRSTYYMSHTKQAGIEAMEQVVRWSDFYDRFFRRTRGRSIYRNGNRNTAISATSIHYASGRKFQIFASSPKLVRGPADAPHYLFDEFEFHRDAAAVLQAATPVLMMGTAAVTIISTVLHEGGAFWNFCEKIKSGTQPGSLHEISFDQALADGYYERIVRSRMRSPFIEDVWGVDDPVLAAELGVPHEPGARTKYREMVWASLTNPSTELDLQPMRSGDRYYSPELVRRCMDDQGAVHRWTAPRDYLYVLPSQQEKEIAAYVQSIEYGLERLRSNPPREWYAGIDFGRYRDLTVMQFGYPEGEIMRWPFVLELEDCPFDAQNIFWDEIVKRLQILRRAAFDKEGNGAQLFEHALRQHGSSVVEGMAPNEDWYREWQPKLKLRYENRTIRTPYDPMHIADMGSVKLVEGVAKVPRGSKKMPSTGDGKARFRHGDFAISNVLGNYAARDAVIPANSSPGRSTRVGTSDRRAASRM